MRTAAAWVIGALFLLSSASLEARQASDGPGPDRLRVFLDCQTHCDINHVRREVDWVDWVRDRRDGDVHLLVTGQGAGGGGMVFTLAFLGEGRFEGIDDELEFSTSGDATSDEIREDLVAAVSLGLGRYAARTPSGRRLRIRAMGGPPGGQPGRPGGPGGAQDQTSPEDDPWDFWVFRLGATAFLNGESQNRSSNVSGSFSANRTTEEWKISLSSRFSERKSEFDFPDGTSYESTIESWNAGGIVVKSLTERWSLGVRGRVGSESYRNQDNYWSLTPGIEFNLFPYTESTRREFTFQYTVGPTHFNYSEPTIYFQEEETRWQHSLTASLDVTQPWGQANIGLSGSQYLHDTSFNNLSLFASANIRLFRGFRFNVSGRYARVRDQLYIPAGTLTNEEILLRQRAQATDYSYFTSFGISYQFGSIFNNVVNPRFGGGDGGGERMMIMF